MNNHAYPIVDDRPYVTIDGQPFAVHEGLESEVRGIGEELAHGATVDRNQRHVVIWSQSDGIDLFVAGYMLGAKYGGPDAKVPAGVTLSVGDRRIRIAVTDVTG